MHSESEKIIGSFKKIMNKRMRKKYKKQHGTWINVKDTWNLDEKIADYILPRLILFKEVNNGYPGIEPMDTPEKWDEALDKMILSFTLIKTKWEDNSKRWATPEEWLDTIKNGLRLFAEWYNYLGW